MPSDIVILRKWCRQMSGPGCLVLDPPTTKDGPSDAAEVHSNAFELLDAQGLAPETAYFGGHTQSEAFNSKGRMVGVLELQHGGDLAAIRAILDQLPEEFEYAGGGSEDETFAIALRFVADAIDLASPRAVETALEGMGRGLSRSVLHPRPTLSAPLTQARIEWLRRVLTAPEVTDDARESAFELLDAQHGVTDEGLDDIANRALADPSGYRGAADGVVNLLWERGRIDDATELALAVTPQPGQRIQWYEGESLVLAPGEATLARARELGLLVPQARIESFLSGEPVLPVAIRLAEAADDRDDEQFTRLVAELPILAPAPTQDEPEDGYANWKARRSAETLRDPLLPGWLRELCRKAINLEYQGLKPNGTLPDRGWGTPEVDAEVLTDLYQALQGAKR